MEVLHPRCAGLDVHSRQVSACVRVAAGSTVTTEHREFATTTAGLFELSAWLTEAGCTHVAMEATGVYCRVGRRRRAASPPSVSYALSPNRTCTFRYASGSPGVMA